MPSALVVDDTPSVLSAVSTLLRRAGYEVTTAVSGPTALRAADAGSFDIAVVDYDIPPPNGVDVLAQLRVTRPECAGVLVSGALDVDIAMEAVNRGAATRVLRKPYRSQDLLDAARAALATRRVQAPDKVAQLVEQEALAECLDGEHLRLAAQPIYESGSGRVAAYEALLRSDHSVLPGPLEVLGAAERGDRLTELGERVSDLAVGWLRQMPITQRLFVNLHPHQLADSDDLLSSLDPIAPYAPRVVLEITERSRLDDLGEWRRSVERLRERGFSLAVDDLGAGFATLSVLAEVKPAFVKVDQSIVRGSPMDEHKRRLLELLAQFAVATGSRLVAEGIECEAEAATARRCGAGLLQGYLLGRPGFSLVPDLAATGSD